MNLQSRIWDGRSFPLGANLDGKGVNFAVFSEAASAMELCRVAGERQAECIRLKEYTDHVWHTYLPDILPTQLYGYRAHAPYEPATGLRFNPNKVLLDLYAPLVGRDLHCDDALFGYKIGEDDLSLDERDSAPFAPLAMVVDPAFTWDEDRAPHIHWHRTLIYELHVKSFTQSMPGVPESLRGTYAGRASEAAINHLLDVNVTTFELLPVHHRVNDRHLIERDLSNHWGYNTLAFKAPGTRFASDRGHAVNEFKTMVSRLHEAGIEVILDVVYNHTGEGSHLGPTLSMCGLDHQAYYPLSPQDPRYYMDFTGWGNTPNMRHPRMLQFIMDSLRYRVEEMHIDGFRFDLASTLARELYEVDRLGAFFDIIHQDAVLSRTKLVAEPWDVGSGGYQVGNFPVLWTKWNGEYRDTVRRFGTGIGEAAPQFASRLCGSTDSYERGGRKPYASINFVTCQDGFTLSDLVSYYGKHNEANGEENRDGSDDSHSGNCGAEGPTDHALMKALRLRQQRNMLATLLLSQGVPKLLAGDEFGHTQNGNNNTYFQDNELTWLDWSDTPEKNTLLESAKKLTRIRREQPVLKRRRFFQGRPIKGEGVADVSWFRPDGTEMTEPDWSGSVKVIGLRFAGDLMNEVDDRGEPIVGDTLCSSTAGTERFAASCQPPTPTIAGNYS